jgi:hypothetical protein
MTNNEVPQTGTTTPTSVDSYLDHYTPRRDYTGQWDRLRPEVLALIGKLAPTNIDQAYGFFSALGDLLEGEISRDPQASLAELLTDEGIERTIARLNLIRGSRKMIQGRRTFLTHLHRTIHNLPPVLSGPRQKRQASDPITSAEVDEFLAYMSKPRKPMDLHVTRRFILALGAGLTGAKADAAQIHFDDTGIQSITDGKGATRPLSKKWFTRLNAVASPDLETYKQPSEQALCAWLRNENLSYLWPRLRDEWLLEQLDGSEPALLQMRRAQITEYDTNRLLLRWEKEPLPCPIESIKERKVFLQIECDGNGVSHHLYQPLNNEGPDKESGNAMNATARGKISKAQARRMNAAHAATVMGAPGEIPAYHTDIINRYVCKGVSVHDHSRVHKAFASVMERTTHIKSRAFFLKNCSDVSCLAAWAAASGRDLTWTSLMNHELIHDYTRSLGGEASTPHFSQRLRRLKVLASHLNPGIAAPPRVAPVGHKAVSDPYTKEEMAIITRVARNQQSPGVTRQLAFVLGACRGAGAGASELRALRRKDVEDRGEIGVFITLGEGATKRTIPIRREWEAQMRRGIEGLSPSSLALGTVRNRRNIAGEIIDRTVALGKSCPHIEAGRLRTTWIAELMSEAIPIQVILNAAGLKGARTLTDLARRYSQEDMNECLGVLRGAA